MIGFGTAGRIAYSAVRQARAQGIPVGLFRPVSLSPFPSAQIAELSKNAQSILVVEMNTGQMLEDILQVVGRRCPVQFYGRMGGIVPFPDEILTEIQRLAKEKPGLDADPRAVWIQHMKEILN